MKKNDCFNLEKQKIQLQQQLDAKNNELMTLKQTIAAQYDEKQAYLQQQIQDLENSHNEQLEMINHYIALTQQKSKLSLQVFNSAQRAVGLTKKYMEEMKNMNKASNNTQKEIEENENQIQLFEQQITNDLIPTDPP